ncbi:MAG: hypothetical protein ABIT71_14165 [Vicinamibacteraceae bacterium]
MNAAPGPAIRPGRRAAIVSLAFVALAGAATACHTASDADADAQRRSNTPAMRPPWTINGARTGMVLDQVVALHGAPDKTSGYPSRRTSTWISIDLWVTFDANGRAVDITGTKLMTLDGKTIVSLGMSEDDVVVRAGAGSTRGSFQTGSGVISIGWKRVGAEHRFTDDTTRYGLGVSEGQLKFIRAQALPVADP